MAEGQARGGHQGSGGAGFPARGVAYFEGRFVPLEEARVSIATHAFNYGTATFEGIRAYWNEDRGELYLVKLREHYRRLLDSARLLRIDVGKTLDDLCELTVELLRRNGYREDVYVRPIAYKATRAIKVGLLGFEDAFCCYTAPMAEYLPIDRGLSVTVSGWRRNDDNAIPSRAKITGSYVNAALAVADAEEAGFDEAILLTADGHVSEASAANIFLVLGGRLVTPAVADDILVGITRGAVMELAARLGVPVTERRVDRSELYVADEIFLCGTGVQVAPVTRVDGRPVGEGKVGELTRAVQDLYLRAVHGEVEEFLGWLTPVYGAESRGGPRGR
ncbi:MAG TPA: branched-chain amino acid transaminase [Actinomycetota bacterium]|nr:branched-chain amino acid transaminase [Actinomycetota bacterium]